jgi:hypothetical protein
MNRALAFCRLGRAENLFTFTPDAHFPASGSNVRKAFPKHKGIVLESWQEGGCVQL